MYKMIPKKIFPQILIPTIEITKPIPAFEERITALENDVLSVGYLLYISLIHLAPTTKPEIEPNRMEDKYILQMPKYFRALNF